MRTEPVYGDALGRPRTGADEYARAIVGDCAVGGFVVCGRRTDVGGLVIPSYVKIVPSNCDRSSMPKTESVGLE